VTGPVVEVVGLEVFAHHGVYEHERRDGQPFLFDVRLIGSSASEQSDRLEDAIDYGAVCDRVVELAGGGPYSLLERLAAVVGGGDIDFLDVVVAHVHIRTAHGQNGFIGGGVGFVGGHLGPGGAEVGRFGAR